MGKIQISLQVTDATMHQLEKLAEALVPGVQLSRGDVVGYLTAEKMKALGLDGSGLLKAVSEKEVANG